MSAVFGRLNASIPDCCPGMNVLQADDPAVIGDWAAFIATMFYGPEGQESLPATCRSGRLDCAEDSRELILARVTRSPAAPMGEFLGAYANTHLPVPGLTGQNCGETLLKLSREAFQRSAILSSQELRALTSLSFEPLPAGYSDAIAALRLQLNTARRVNAEHISHIQSQLDELTQRRANAERLRQQTEQAQARLDALNRQVQALEQDLETLRLLDDTQFQQQLSEAEDAVTAAQQKFEDTQRRLEADHIPDNDTIRRLRGAIVNLETTRKALDKSRQQRDDAMKALLQAESAVADSPFNGKSPEGARHVVHTLPKISGAVCALPPLAGLAAGAAAGALAQSASLPVEMLPATVAGGVLGGLISLFYVRRRHGARQAALSAYRVSTVQALSEAAEQYYDACQARDEAQEACDRCRAEADALYASLSSNEQAILLEIRRFAPDAHDIPSADQLLRTCAQRRRDVADAHADIAKARHALEALTQQAVKAAAFLRSHDSTAAALRESQASRAAAEAALETLTAQLQSSEDPAALSGQAEALQAELTQQAEAQANLRLLLSAADAVNASLQSRIAPQLGARAAEICTQLCSVPECKIPPQQMPFMLYLSARLAISEAAGNVPLVLADFLTPLPQPAMTAAARWLRRAAGQRQVLAFTTSGREAELFAGDGEVLVQELTNSSQMI